jgi:transcriptional regulator with XRE-family HTH domain
VQSFEIDSYIQGEKFKQARESQSLTRKSLAQKACCSVLQIEEIEETLKDKHMELNELLQLSMDAE